MNLFWVGHQAIYSKYSLQRPTQKHLEYKMFKCNIGCMVHCYLKTVL